MCHSRCVCISGVPVCCRSQCKLLHVLRILNFEVDSPVAQGLTLVLERSNTQEARTTGALEGRHRALKLWLAHVCPQMHMLRLDHIDHLLCVSKTEQEFLARRIARGTAAVSSADNALVQIAVACTLFNVLTGDMKHVSYIGGSAVVHQGGLRSMGLPHV